MSCAAPNIRIESGANNRGIQDRHSNSHELAGRVTAAGFSYEQLQHHQNILTTVKFFLFDRASNLSHNIVD